jgi:hypothetical protein
MLPSQQIKQEQAEAIKIAEESAKPRGASKASKAATIELPDGRAPDLTGGVEVAQLRFPANVMMANSSSSLGVGAHYSNSMSISGPITRLVMMPGGFVYGAVATGQGVRWIIAFASGMTAELVP